MGLFGDTLPTSPVPSTYAGLSDTDIDEWGCNDWKIYHQRNESLLGRTQANEIIAIDFSNASIWSSVVSFCKFNCAWRQYFLDRGFQGGFLDNVFCDTAKIITDVSGGASDITGGIGTTAKILKVVLPVALIGGAIYLTVNTKARKKLLG